MPAGIIYRIQFTNTEGKFVKVDISDNSIDATSPAVIELEGSDSPIRLSAIDNDEGIFTAIRSQQCTIEFVSDSNYGVRTFSSGPDDRFKVTVSYDLVIMFEGFLTLDDNKELFVDGRNIVELTASDKIASLRDVDMVDFVGDVPKGKYTLAQMCAMCLRLTGIERSFRIVNTLTHGTGSITTGSAVFAAADKSITFGIVNSFYPGMIFDITGSVSNNGRYTVDSIASSTKIILKEAVVNETVTIYNVTFTDPSSSFHFFQTYVDALTFEGDINTLVDPYTILSRILGNMHELFYYNFNWWVVRKADKHRTTLPVATYSIEGEYESIADQTFPKSFGFNETHWFADERTEIKTIRPLGKAILNANYRYPTELICNNAFERGTEVVAPNLSAPTSFGQYTPECWELARLEGQTVNTTFYIYKTFEYGYLKLSSLVINPASTTGTPFTFAKPVNGMEIFTGDKVTFNFAYRYFNNFGAGEGAATLFPARVWGIDEAGKVWHWWNTGTPLDPSTFFWQDPDIWNADPFTQYERLYPYAINMDQDNEAEETSISIELHAAPVNLEVFIGFNQMHQGNDSGDNQAAIFSSLDIEYTPYVNGSYRKFSGERHTTSRTEAGYNSKYEKEAFIFDAARPLYKGALFFELSSTYYLTSRWKEPLWNFSPQPLLWWAVFGIWNQYRNSPTLLEFVAAGVGSQWPHFIHHIQVTDIDTLTTGRLFEIITFEKDLKRAAMSGTMPELYRSDYDYDDPYEFKYITT